MVPPLISVVTINYNHCAGLRKTLQSVLSQTCDRFEYIVIDGGSTDGSVELISANASRISRWVSERDSGISDAFNKGIRLGSGDWIIFLNAGDYFCSPTVLRDMEPFIRERPAHVSVLYGRINLVTDTGRVIKSYGSPFSKARFDLGNTIPHQAAFTHRSFFEKYGLFNESCKKVMDMELYLRDKQFQPLFVNLTVSNFVFGGTSQTDLDAVIRETLSVIQMHRDIPRSKLLLYYYYKRCKIVYRHMVCRIMSRF